MKHSYGRGLGEPLQCPEDEDQDWYTFGLCYPKCGEDAEGLGPLCWDECKGNYPATGGPLCCKNRGLCHSELYNLTVNLPMHIAQAVMDGRDITKEIQDMKQVVEDVLGYELPMCHSVSLMEQW